MLINDYFVEWHDDLLMKGGEVFSLVPSEVFSLVPSQETKIFFRVLRIFEIQNPEKNLFFLQKIHEKEEEERGRK